MESSAPWRDRDADYSIDDAVRDLEAWERQQLRSDHLASLVPEAPPMSEGVIACRDWSGWLIDDEGNRRPAPCRKADCRSCGAGYRAALFNRLYQGWMRAFPGQRAVLITFTHRARAADMDGKPLETWDRYTSRRGLPAPEEFELGRPLKADYENKATLFGAACWGHVAGWVEGEAKFDLDSSQPGTTARQMDMTAPVVRSTWDFGHWAAYRTFLLHRLRKAFRSRWGRPLEYLVVTEWTKQGIPHYHLVVPEGVLKHQPRYVLVSWFKSQWCHLDPSVSWERGATLQWWDDRRSDTPRTPGAAIGYALKYVMKGYEHLRRKPAGTQYRRYAYTSSWDLPAVGHPESFVWGEDAEQFNRREYAVLYGRHSYYCGAVRDCRRADLRAKAMREPYVCGFVRDGPGALEWLSLQAQRPSVWRKVVWYPKRQYSAATQDSYSVAPLDHLVVQWRDGTERRVPLGGLL